MTTIIKGGEKTPERAGIRLEWIETTKKLPRNPGEVARQYTAAVQEGVKNTIERERWMARAEQLLHFLKVTISQPEEKLAHHAVTAALAEIKPYQAYLESAGMIQAKDGGEAGSIMRKAGADLWVIMAERALSQAQGEGALLTPLLYQILSSATYAAGTIKKTKAHTGDEIVLGEGLDERLERVRDWVEYASAEEMEPFSQHESFLGEAVAERTHLASTKEGILQILPFITNRAARVLDNPHLSADAAETLINTVILSIPQSGDGDDAKERENYFDFWRKAARKGVAPSRQQIDLILIILHRAVREYTGKTLEQVLRIAAIREAGTDPQIRKALLDFPSGLRPEQKPIVMRVGLLGVSQGKDLADLIKLIVQQIDFQKLEAQGFVRELEQLYEWNFHGTTEADFLPLVESETESVRNQGRQMMVKWQGQYAKPEASPIRKIGR